MLCSAVTCACKAAISAGTHPSPARAGTSVKATKMPVAIKDPRPGKPAMRHWLLCFSDRKPRLISLAVAVPLMSVLFGTAIVVRSSSLVCMLDSLQGRFVAFDPLQDLAESGAKRTPLV